MKNGLKVPGILMIIVAVVLFCVQEFVLAGIFGFVAVLMLVQKPKPAASGSSGAHKPKAASPRSGVDSYGYPGRVEDYFVEILRDAFPDYTVRTNVFLTAGTIPLSIALFRDGDIKLAILLCPKNSWDTVDIRQTMHACKSRRIPCLRFMAEFRNDKVYVVDRVNRALYGMK